MKRISDGEYSETVGIAMLDNRQSTEQIRDMVKIARKWDKRWNSNIFCIYLFATNKNLYLEFI